MKSVHFAILGCGKIGTRHADKMKEINSVKLSSVCDIIEDRAQMLSDKHGCKKYISLEEMLKDDEIDFVNICTPSGLHAEHTIACLNAGKNVLCEKPMALTVADASRMYEAAVRNNKLLYVVKQNRYNPPVELVRSLMENGKLGTPLMCVINMIWNRGEDYYKSDSWRGTKALDGGTIYTQGCHFVDLLLMFLGKPKSIYSMMSTKTHKIEIEDTGVITAEFKNGAYGIVNYTTCATNKNFEGSITLVFSKGTIKIGGEYINTVDYFQVEGVDGYKLEETPMLANDYGTYKGTMSNHDQIFKDIIKKINGEGEGQLVSGDEAISTVAFIEAAIQSAEKHKIIYFN